jgi:hypothetical protein
VEEQGVHPQEKKKHEFCSVTVAGVQPGCFRPEQQPPAEEHRDEAPQRPRLELLDNVGDRLFRHSRPDQAEIHDSDRTYGNREPENVGGFNQRKYIGRLADTGSDRRVLNPLTNFEYGHSEKIPDPLEKPELLQRQG